MTASSKPAAHTADREIVTTRDFDAPRELVFAAWTDAKHVSNWWGPNGFTTTTHVMDVRPGGEWRFIMHGPDGRDYPNRISYLEVARPERLVYKHGGEVELEPVDFHTTVTFTEVNGKTRVTMRAVFPSAEERDRVAREYGAVEGGQQTLARLAEHLAQSTGTVSDRTITSTRLIEAPQERVFQAFANPDQLKYWWGPTGFSNTIEKFELYPGGTWRLTMHGPDGADYHNESVFTEVSVPDRVVFEHREPVHRFTMEMTFATEGDRTRLTWRMVFESASEFAKVKDFIVPANEQNFDRLAAHLASL